MNNRIALGTVQFGLDYGIANQGGQINNAEARKILDYASTQGIDTLDTAIAYGESEKILGDIGVEKWDLISKLPATSLDSIDVTKWVENSVNESLERLGVSHLKGLMLHDSTQLLGSNGEELYHSLISLKEQKLVEKIGISIYNTDELGLVFGKYDIDIVQAPFNILDQRLETSGWLTRLKNSGIEVHSRSAFLQGLLLMDLNNRPVKFNRWKSQWQIWHQWLGEQKLTPLQACLGFVLSHKKIDRVVVGVDSLNHLQEIMASALELCVDIPGKLMSDDLDLINPSRWSHL